ncbi:hypothetical protein RHECNPAF_3340019 [Rhizobium etli CNPAF512]|nr:hypothetical protein RHECNPAF_3340019 [Rhizobium etli CNPAF512]
MTLLQSKMRRSSTCTSPRQPCAPSMQAATCSSSASTGATSSASISIRIRAGCRSTIAPK